MRTFLIICVALLIASCSEKSTPVDIETSGNGDLQLAFVVPDNIQHLVATAEAQVSAADMDTITATLTVTDSTVSGTIEDVPAGNDRHFEVFVYDSTSLLTYYGDAFADVVAGETIVVDVILYPQGPGTGTVIINGTFGDVDLDLGLIGYWPFTENANDASGNGNHGTVYGATLTEDAFGNLQQAYAFNGIDQYIDFGNSSLLKPQLPISISGWVRHNSVRSRILITNYQDDRYNGVFVNFGQAEDSVRYFSLSYGDGGATTSANRRTKRILAPEMNTWFHFTGVIRGATDMTIYIDGVDAGGEYVGTGGPLAYSDGPVTIGRIDSDPHGPPLYMNGSVDEIRIYNRALNDAEAAVLYQLQ